jgi:hypothetical protein
LSRLLPRYEVDETPGKVAKAVREGEAAQVKTFAGSTPAGDERRLRGIPCVGPNVEGSINYTRPDREVLRLDDR